MSSNFCDLLNGNDANSGASQAARVKTIAKLAQLCAGNGLPGLIAQSAGPTSLGQLGVWSSNGITPGAPSVVLTSPVTQTISLCDTPWTPSANVAVNILSDCKEGAGSLQIAIGASFTTGLAAFIPTGALDLSSKQQVTFWLKQTAGTLLFHSGMSGLTANMSLRLCSDALGATPVNTITLPTLFGGTLGNWLPVTIDSGGALSASIQSIALYVDTNLGAQTIQLDCILAALPSTDPAALTLTSLIGHADSLGAGGANNDTWYGIASIVGVNVHLDNNQSTTVSQQYGWSGRAVAILASTNTTPILVTAPNHELISGDLIAVVAHPVNTAADWTGTPQQVIAVDANHFTIVGSVGNGIGPSAGGLFVISMSRTVWKRETLRFALLSSGTLQSIASSGVMGTPIQISGGWDSATMSTQVGETWIDGRGMGVGLEITDQSWIDLSAIGFARCSTGLLIDNVTNSTLTISGVNNCDAGALGTVEDLLSTTLSLTAANNNGGNGCEWTGKASILNVLAANNNLGAGVQVDALASGCTITLGTLANNFLGAAIESSDNLIAITGAYFGGQGLSIAKNQKGIITCAFSVLNSGAGVYLGPGNRLNIATALNTDLSIFLGADDTAGDASLINSYLAETTKFAVQNPGGDIRVISYNDQFSGETVVYCDAGDGTALPMIQTDLAIVHTPGGRSWKLSPQNVLRNSYYPLELTLARLTLLAGILHTITVWTRRDSITTLQSRFLLRGEQIIPVISDVAMSASSPANQWEQLTLVVTPTQSGVVELVGQVWDGTGTSSNAWFDDLTIAS